MAHPKHKTSKKRRDQRRSHHAISPATLAACGNCGTTVKYHTVCPECGFYRGKLAIAKEVVA